MEIFKDLFPLEDRWGKDGVFTPTNIVKDMIDLLPDSIWNPESTFIDISCKTGAFLAEIYTRLDTELSKLDEYKDPVKRRSHILNNQLFGLALRNDESLFFSRRNVFGDPFSDNIDVINAGNSSYLDLVKQKQYSIIETQLKGKFGRMKFDVVVGNPPYNNDIYLKFVTFGDQLASKYTLMITPAKWQAKGGKDNEEFRKNIVPRMSHIVYYPITQEIFNIRNVDGISYYLIGKNIVESKTIYNKSKAVKVFNSITNRMINKQLNNCAEQIIDRIQIVNNRKFRPLSLDVSFFGVSADLNNEGPYKLVSGGNVIGTCSEKSISKQLKYKDCIKVVINRVNGNSFYSSDGTTIGLNKMYILKEDELPVFNYLCIGAFDSETDANYMVSYFDTKIIRFIVLTSQTGQGLQEDQTWRFVPDPGNFDHIFTDEELYKKYSLTDDEIEVIESVIKERKQ